MDLARQLPALVPVLCIFEYRYLNYWHRSSVMIEVWTSDEIRETFDRSVAAMMRSMYRNAARPTAWRLTSYQPANGLPQF